MKLPRSLHIIGGVALGGAERFFIRLVNALHRKGVPVAAVTTAGGQISSGILSEIPHFHAPQWSTWDWYSRWLINRAIHSFKPDIVQTYMGRATRIVHLPQGGAPIHIARLGGFYNLKGYQHAHAWVANTHGIERYLLNSGLPVERVECIGNFVDPPASQSSCELARLREKYAIPYNALCILGLGRHHKNKGWEDLLDSFSKLPPEHDGHPLWLIMVGDGPIRSKLFYKAKQLGINSRITWTGWQKDPAIWFQMSDIFVCASRHEPLGNVILEAWANRVPIVSTRSEGPSELLKDGVDGVMIPIGDSKAMSLAIMKILNSPTQNKKKLLDAGSIKLEKNFSEEAIVHKYLDFYRRLLGWQ